jgi:hypothetical protein
MRISELKSYPFIKKLSRKENGLKNEIINQQERTNSRITNAKFQDHLNLRNVFSSGTLWKN